MRVLLLQAYCVSHYLSGWCVVRVSQAVLSFVVPRGEARAGWSPRAVSLMDDQLSGPRGVWQRVEMRKTSKGDCAIARVDGVYVDRVWC